MLTSGVQPLPQNVSKIKKSSAHNNVYRHFPEHTREDPASLAEMFPCDNPFTPRMSNMIERQVTYRHWPGHVNATTNQLADAGFIYLGTGDRLKCFYCNGGLQNWQKEEDPWFEHAKWFPNCEYLLRRKGIDYVDHVGCLFPDLKRPTPNNQTSERTSQNLRFPKTSSPPSTSSLPPSPSSIPSSSSLPGILVADDAASSSRSCNSLKPTKKSLNEAMENFIVIQAIAMGFDEDTVREIVQKKLLEENQEYTTLLDLVDDLQTMEEKETVEEVSADVFKANTPRPQSLSISSSSSGQSPSLKVVLNNNLILDSVGSEADEGDYLHSSTTPQDVIQSLIDERTCKVCLDRPNNCVFQPCGHVCCCVQCSSAITKCPICRQTLTRIVKFYR